MRIKRIFKCPKCKHAFGPVSAKVGDMIQCPIPTCWHTFLFEGERIKEYYVPILAKVELVRSEDSFCSDLLFCWTDKAMKNRAVALQLQPGIQSFESFVKSMKSFVKMMEDDFYNDQDVYYKLDLSGYHERLLDANI